MTTTLTPSERDDLLTRLGDRHVVASVSGGKDSTAMCLHLQELGIPYTPVFMDTGWESDASYRYLREELPAVVGELTWLRNLPNLTGQDLALALELEEELGHVSAMVRWSLYKSTFPNRLSRWCTETVKLKAIRPYYDELDYEPISAVGVRAEESKARSELPEWQWWKEADCEQWRPLILWKLEDVVSIHQRHGVRPNPLYLKGEGVDRVGCWPCIFSRKAEIRHFGATDPKRVAFLERLEGIMQQRNDAMRTRNDKPLRPHGWFLDRLNNVCAGWTIRRAIEWANTNYRNGKQVELFAAAESERGCMRWGMCETHSPKEAK